MKRYLQFIIVIIFILLAGCGENTDTHSATSDANNYCLEQNGTIEKVTKNDQVIEYCNTIHTGIFDEGTIDYIDQCEITDFYNDHCEEEEEIILESVLLPQRIEKQTTDISLSNKYFEKVDEILSTIDNTGYTHRPFSLDPTTPYPEINATTTPYNLFLDCSGFVGYYVLQQLTPDLYRKLDRQYSCGPLQEEDNVTTHPARPLAADFVDKILHHKTPSVDDENITIATVDTNSSNLCWGRVDHIRDAKPGDIIAYIHDGYIDTDTLYCCKKESYDDNKSKYHYTSHDKILPEYSAEECINDEKGRIIYKTNLDSNGNHRSTGHVMFIASYPYQCESLWCDEKVKNEWVVKVADSTNVKHSYDTRQEGRDNSNYEDNDYHAWRAVYGGDDTIHRCSNGIYRRNQGDCPDNNYTTIELKGSSKPNHPTGLGAGYIFINNTMDGHRPKFSKGIAEGKIAIGRPIECK